MYKTMILAWIEEGPRDRKCVKRREIISKMSSVVRHAELINQTLKNVFNFTIIYNLKSI